MVVSRRLTGVWMGLVATVLALAALPHAQAAPAVLDELPDGVPMAVVVPSLSGLDAKVKMVANAMGMMAPEMIDVVGQIKAETGINAGLNADGAAVFVILAPLPTYENMKKGQEPEMAVLVPITDYKAFLSNFNAQPAEGVVAVTMKDGSPAFTKQVGSYAVLSPKQAAAEGYQPGKKSAQVIDSVSALGKSVLEGSDAFIYINLQAIEPLAMPALAEGRAQMAQDLQAAGAVLPGVQEYLTMYLDAVEAVVRDGRGVVIGLGANELGIHITKAAAFDPGSATGKMFKAGGDAKGPMEHLPNQDYLFAGAVDMQALAVGDLIDKLMAGLEKMPMTAGMVGAVKPLIPSIKQSKGIAFLMTPPDQANMMAGGLFKGVNIIHAADAPAMSKAYQDVITNMNNLAIEMPAVPDPQTGQVDPNAPKMKMTYTTQYTPNVLQIDGVNVDQYNVSVQLPPEMMQANPMMGQMMMMTGAGNQTGYIATQGEYVVITTSADAAAVRAAIDSVKNGQGLGTDQTIAQVREQLGPKPAMEAYINVRTILNLGNMFAGMFLGQALQIPEKLPPVAMSMNVEDAAMQGKLFVPISVIKAIKDIADQVKAIQQQQMQQNGGGQQGQGDQDGPPPAPF
ncbi:MAG: hypothetical protein GC164_15740 [Phycisphaera sp.]|nr:hypothetical protein [Phycisphaera sp.]